MRSEKPLVILIIPKVATKAGRPTLLTSKPLDKPTIAPIPRIAMSVNKGDAPDFATIAPKHAVKPTKDPTERSIPPVIMIKACPTANMAMSENCRKTFTIFLAVKKYGLAMDSQTQIANRANKTLISGLPNMALILLLNEVFLELIVLPYVG